MPEVAATLEVRRLGRAAASRSRLRRRWMTVGAVLAPVLLSLVYRAFIAVPRYTAEARFSVRSNSSQPSGMTGATSLLATGDPTAMAGGFVDGWAVSDFIKSRDCMEQLDRRIGLRHRLQQTGLDPVDHLAPDASEDDLYRVYQSVVQISYNLMEQVDVLEVSAASPQDAALISQALIEIAQQFVNRMDEQGVDDALKVSRHAVANAQAQASAARAALAKWRIDHGNLDPVAESTMLLSLVSQIEAELGTARVNLAKVLALGNPDHPMLRPAQAQVATLQQQLADTRRRMSGSGNTQANQLREYEELKNAQTFDDSNLAAAQQSYQQAFTDTLRLQRYLSVIAKPLPTDRPTSPSLPILLAGALALGLALALLARLAMALQREFRLG